ncbi:MAG: hypothetical protein PHU51_04080 [Candidatus Nanoarchaeia archaeon]|nr:hypothetical protein [Candidatus Nanoarchaeia archaeon]
MVEVQNHGFIFENWVKKILKVDKLATNYTQKWDVEGEIPISVKFMGLTNALEFGSTVRIWEIEEPFTLVIGRWEQVKDKKIVQSIDEIKITLNHLKLMKGQITLEEIKEFDKKIKRFPAGKEGQKQGIAFAKEWKNERKDRLGLLTITHKIDSKNQRRIQCNINYNNYVKLFGEPSMLVEFRGVKFEQEINHAARIFNKIKENDISKYI